MVRSALSGDQDSFRASVGNDVFQTVEALGRWPKRFTVGCLPVVDHHSLLAG